MTSTVNPLSRAAGDVFQVVAFFRLVVKVSVTLIGRSKVFGRLIVGFLLFVLGGCVDPSFGGYDANGNPVSNEKMGEDQEKQVLSSAMLGRKACGEQFGVDPDSAWNGPKDKALDYVQCINNLEKDVLLPFLTSRGFDISPFLRAHSERERLALQRERGRIDGEEYGVEIRSLKNRLEAEMRDEANAVMAQRQQLELQRQTQQYQSRQALGNWLQQQQALENASRPVQTNCTAFGSNWNCTTR